MGDSKYQNEKACGSAGTQPQDKMRTCFGELDSQTDFNIGTGFISSFLPEGAENAMRAETLMQLTGCENRRQLRLLIEKERETTPILTNNQHGGYYLPTDDQRGDDELRRFISMMESNAFGLMKSTKSARRELKRRERRRAGQMELANNVE